MSLKTKVTLWFTIILVIIISITYVAIITVSSSLIKKNLKSSLIETVEKNVDEIEYYFILSSNNYDRYDQYIEYNNGFIQIDDDFLDEVDGITTGLYDETKGLIYGENPIGSHLLKTEFSDSVIQTITVSETEYYIFDRKLEGHDLDGLWLRGTISEKEGKTNLSEIATTSLILLIIIALIGIIVCVFITGNILKPIRKITDAAIKIGSHDLKERINLGNGKDELSILANQFDKMVDRLDKAFEEERRFTSDASHELRTPVSVISAQCEYILESPKETEEYIEALEVISRQTNKMSSLINDMLYLSRFENKKEQYVLKDFNLSDLILSVCEDMVLLKKKNIKLSYFIEPDIIIKGDRELLERLALNLISNGYKYGKENGEIQVTLKRSGNNTVLSVKDDGIGIEKDEQSKIFGRFYCSDKSRTEEGTGLGLSIAMEIAKFHGGNITLESEPQKGSTFTFIL